MSFDDVVPKLKALLRKKITDHKCNFDAPKFLDEIIESLSFFTKAAIKVALNKT